MANYCSFLAISVIFKKRLKLKCTSKYVLPYTVCLIKNTKISTCVHFADLTGQKTPG